MQKTKLILFSYDFPPSNGGIARLCQEIVVGMKSHYEEVIVLTRRKEGLNIPYNSINIKMIELPNRRILSEITALWVLLKIKNKSSYDIVCGIWHPEGFLSIVSGFKNIFILGHGTEFLSGTSNFRAKFWLPYYAKFILKKVKIVIANSLYTKELIKSISKNIKCEVLPLGVNQHFFNHKLDEKQCDTKFKLGTVSRIHQFKGYDFIARVLAKLPIEYKEQIMWNIAGTGPYLESLKKLVNEYGLSNQVNFNGYLKDELLPLFYSKNDVFILCTREQPNSTQVEGFGLVFLEAQSCGIPVIGTNTGGIPCAIKHNEGGWLIEQDDEIELTKLIIHLIDNPLIIKEQGLIARRRVEDKFTWDLYCNNLFYLLNNFNFN